MTDRKRPPTYDDDDDDDNGPIGIGGLNTNKPKKKVKFGDDNQGSKGVYKKTLSRYNKEQDDIAGNYEEGDDDIDLDVRKRGKQVKLEGYESSDSEDSDGGKSKAVGDEDDMFAMDEDDDKKEKDSDKKKKVQYLKKEEIEGQEWAKTDEFTEDGIKIDAFNMDEDLEEGQFDENGMFIRKKDEHAHHDSWLSGVSKTDIQKAKVARERHEARMRVENARVERENEALDVNDIWLKMLGIMRPRETAVAALSRLGALVPKKEPAWKQKLQQKKNKGKSAPVNESAQDPELIEKSKKEIEELTALADKLLSLGHFDVYDQTYETIVRKLRIDDVLPDEWQPGMPLPKTKSADIETSVPDYWEYKWDLKEDSEIFGPFGSAEMKAWKDQGFFDSAPVFVRKVTSGTSNLSVSGGFVPIQEVEL